MISAASTELNNYVICRFLIFKYSHALTLSIEMDKWNQELIDVLTRCRSVKRESKAASLTTGINKAQLTNDLIFGKHE
jgi:hypothetical protein